MVDVQPSVLTRQHCDNGAGVQPACGLGVEVGFAEHTQSHRSDPGRCGERHLRPVAATKQPTVCARFARRGWVACGSGLGLCRCGCRRRARFARRDGLVGVSRWAFLNGGRSGCRRVAEWQAPVQRFEERPLGGLQLLAFLTRLRGLAVLVALPRSWTCYPVVVRHVFSARRGPLSDCHTGHIRCHRSHPPGSSQRA